MPIMSRPPLTYFAPLALLACLALAAACSTERPLETAAASAAGAPSSASNPTILSTAEVKFPLEASRVGTTRSRLERAAAGLLYMSESDYPFLYFRSTIAVSPPLTSIAFRIALGLSPSEPVQELTLDAFFARHIELVDPNDAVAVALVPRYRDLRETIRRELPTVRVFRFGHIQVQCYAVGIDDGGRIVGLTTVAIET